MFGLQVFLLFLFTQMIFTCCLAAYFIEQPAGTTYALINSSVKIDCNISGSTFIPLWKINGTIYNIYTDPPNRVSYVPDGLLIHHVSLHWNYTSFQCYIFGLSSTIGYLYVQIIPDISSTIIPAGSSSYFHLHFTSSTPLMSSFIPHVTIISLSSFESSHSHIILTSFSLSMSPQSLNGSPLKTLAGSSGISNITIDSILYSTETLMMSSSDNQPLVIESIKSSSYGNETADGNSHNVRVIFISAVVSSICASLLMIAAMCLIVFALVRKKIKEKKPTKTFLESTPVYDEPVHDNIQFNPSYGLVGGTVRCTVNPVYEEINLT